MSLYNLMFGKNAWSDVILAVLDLRETDIERFRDSSIDFDNRQIVITTRTGGCSREEYANEKLTSHPCYLYDEDDDFDCTYAYYYFKIPDDIVDDIIKLGDIEKNGVPASIVKKYNEMMNRPETPGDKYKREYDNQQRYVGSQMKSGDIRCDNGWIYYPLSDYGMGAILHSMEEADGKFHLGIISMRVINTHVQKVDDQHVRRVIVERTNQLDEEYYNHVIIKFGEKYPKAVEELKRMIEGV